MVTKPGDRRSARRSCRSAGGWRALALCATLSLWTRPSTAQQPAAPSSLAVQHVTVIDVQDGKVHPDQTVVVAGSRIETVGPASQVAVPAAALRIEGRGKFLIPGLWDMHVHNDEDLEQVDNRLRRYIAHGVTGIREMAQRFEGGADSFRIWQREILAGTRVGPRGVGPSADVNGPITLNAMFGGISEGAGMVKVYSAEQARQVVDSLQAAGMAFIKMHDDLIPVEIYFALMHEARRAGIPVVGHTPTFLNDVQIADSGQRSVEHMSSIRCPIDLAGTPKASPAEAERKRVQACAAAAAAYVRNGTWLVPTLLLNRRTLESQSAEEWQRLAAEQALIAELHRLGVNTIMAGTDLDNRPGFSLLEEVVLLAGAGLTPLQALQTATLNPAVFFHATDSLGAVAPGKLADLVLLDGNPLDDIGNVMRTAAVIANGRYFDRAALDGLDPDAAQFAEQYHHLMAAHANAESAAPSPTVPQGR